jgi:hypothetical protein
MTVTVADVIELADRRAQRTPKARYQPRRCTCGCQPASMDDLPDVSAEVQACIAAIVGVKDSND